MRFYLLLTDRATPDIDTSGHTLALHDALPTSTTWTRAATASGPVMSSTWAIALPAADSISAASCPASLPEVRALTATAAPAEASSRQMARPILRAAPVTSATCPSSSLGKSGTTILRRWPIPVRLGRHDTEIGRAHV